MMDDTPPPRRHGKLREEAADWFAIMRNTEEADIRRKEFEAWLACGALHRAAYSRIAETYSVGKHLKQDAVGGGDSISEAVPTRLPATRSSEIRKPLLIASAVALLSLCAHWVLGVGLTNLAGVAQPPLDASLASTRVPLRLATSSGEIRSFRLDDGSLVALDTDSLVFVRYDASRRDLQLVRGRGRFTVAHENRPFTVHAGRRTVVARGTIFDVAISARNLVRVHLMRGAVDVKDQSQSTIRLSPGQQLLLSAKPRSSPQFEKAAMEDARWPDGLRDYTDIRLADLFEEANRYAKTPLLAATPEVSDIRVSGKFRITDTHRLAGNLADLLALAVITSPASISLARDCPTNSGKNCRSPS
jgi:transmembrane sensor